jgi:regulation of enolase protein 1 (concanavalin A-like superfamily)
MDLGIKKMKFLLTTLTQFTVLLLLAFSSFAVFSQDKQSIKKINVIPYDIAKNEQGGSITVLAEKITIIANKGTDLFTNTTGDKSVDKSPRVLFEPRGDFIFSAKVSGDFTTAYSGGALMVYVNGQHWAKLLFERFKSGHNGIATTVTSTTGDDAYHGTQQAQSYYLKIARHDTSYVFYTSENGQYWNFERHFSLEKNTQVHIGFTAQSPLAEAQQVTFTNIEFKGERFKNYWQGL